MIRASAAATVLALACSGSQEPPVAPDTRAPAPLRSRECPDAPGLELHEIASGEAGASFDVGGHIVSLTVSRDDEQPAALVGELDVKGTIALERHTRSLALDNYASAQRGGAVHQMGLVLHGRVVAQVEVPSAMRGSRFRVPLLVTTEGTGLGAEGEAELMAALRVDRRCFPGR